MYVYVSERHVITGVSGGYVCECEEYVCMGVGVNGLGMGV